VNFLLFSWSRLKFGPWLRLRLLAKSYGSRLRLRNTGTVKTNKTVPKQIVNEEVHRYLKKGAEEKRQLNWFLRLLRTVGTGTECFFITGTGTFFIESVQAQALVI